MEISLYIAVAGIAIGLTGSLLALWQKTRIDKLTKMSGKDLENELDTITKRIKDNSLKVEALEKLVNKYLKRAEGATQKVALERYDAYADVGGSQSFVLAMLDAKNTGVLINVMHTRDSTRVYGKDVSDGKVSATLSAEEEKTLDTLIKQVA